MKTCKVAMVLAPKEFRDEEFSEPYRILTEGGCEVKVVSSGIRPCRGRFGLEVPCELQTEQLKADDFDAVVLVGGPGAMQYYRDITLHKALQNFYDAGKILAAICIAPTILGNMGLLKGKAVTAYMSEHKTLQGFGAKVYTQNPVVKTGQIITANGPEASAAFGKAILEAVTAYKASLPEEEAISPDDQENPESLSQPFTEL